MVGLPLMNGFVGEFLILSSTLAGVGHRWAIAATVGVILSAAYMLSMVQKLFYGQASQTVTAGAPDLRLSEQFVLWPLAVLMLTMGVFPNYWLRAIEMAPKPVVLPQARFIDVPGQPNVVPSQNRGEGQR
jgi:NADH-quinone oxidoreductase subunit M